MTGPASGTEVAESPPVALHEVANDARRSGHSSALRPMSARVDKSQLKVLTGSSNHLQVARWRSRPSNIRLATCLATCEPPC